MDTIHQLLSDWTYTEVNAGTKNYFELWTKTTSKAKVTIGDMAVLLGSTPEDQTCRFTVYANTTDYNPTDVGGTNCWDDTLIDIGSHHDTFDEALAAANKSIATYA